MVTNVPKHLRGDKALADYFEGCGWTVETVSVCREVEMLRRVLQRRTRALMKLEEAWVEWVGNPVGPGVRGYDPEVYSETPRVAKTTTASPLREPEPLIPGLDENGDTETSRDQSRAQSEISDRNGGTADSETDGPRINVHTTRPRPTMRPRRFGAKVDAIEFWEKKFRAADEEVKDLRQTGHFEATHAAFVTFEDVKDAVGPIYVEMSRQ